MSLQDKSGKLHHQNRYKVWLMQAGYDLDAAKDSLNDSRYEWSCYQSTQSVEKALKSVIRHAGWQPPRTHKLGILVNIANKANNLFFDVRISFRKIEAYTFISRYPFIIPGQNIPPHELINANDANTCIALAEEVYTKISEFIKLNRVKRGTKLINLQDHYFTSIEIEKRLKGINEKLKKCDFLQVKKIILYGSFARDKSRPKSTTLDILIIANTELSFIERIQYVRELTKGKNPIVEPLVYTPDEFKYMLEEEGEGYLESAIAEGEVLYEA